MSETHRLIGVYNMERLFVGIDFSAVFSQICSRNFRPCKKNVCLRPIFFHKFFVVAFYTVLNISRVAFFF